MVSHCGIDAAHMCRYGRATNGLVIVDTESKSPDDTDMEAFHFAANAKGIPYTEWWFVWALLAFVIGPMLVGWVWAQDRRDLLPVILVVPLLLGLVFIFIASNCSSLGESSARNCQPGNMIGAGWGAAVIAVSVFAVAAMAASRPGPKHPDRIADDP